MAHYGNEVFADLKGALLQITLQSAVDSFAIENVMRSWKFVTTASKTWIKKCLPKILQNYFTKLPKFIIGSLEKQYILLKGLHVYPHKSNYNLKRNIFVIINLRLLTSVISTSKSFFLLKSSTTIEFLKTRTL